MNNFNHLNNIFKSKVGLNKRIESKFLKLTHISRLNTLRDKFYFGKELKKKIQNNVAFFVKIKCYKGIRHKLKYPTRGQRTHTNAKTRKKLI